MLHYKNLQLYFKVKKKSQWLKSYNEFNTLLYKLMNNAIYGKTM